MSQPYVGEIRIFAGNFAPAGWALCQGQLLAISENETLFNLIGTTYGGDGQNTFALPDLQGRFAIHQGNDGTSTRSIGENGGAETNTLLVTQLPIHTHAANSNGVGAGNSSSPVGNYWGLDGSGQFGNYAASSDGQMNAATIETAGGSQPHENRQPYLAINYIISLFGIFPSQN
jgi:microcystin-dependent protein